MRISFCTTCMNRVEHLRKTLPQNLFDNPDTHGVQVEFVVLNYNSQDGMHDWMMTDPQIQEEIKTGRVVYAKTSDPDVFHMSHAKNMAHRLATGDIVCNLDADNFAGPAFAQALAEIFEENPNAILNPSHLVAKKFDSEERGFFGRVALSRKNFNRLGGYDESYEGWGGEDTNFIRRARFRGLDFVQFENIRFLKIISHSNKERAANMFKDKASQDTEVSKIESSKNSSGFKKMWNAALDRLPVLYKPIVANEGTDFGLGSVVAYAGLGAPISFAVEPFVRTTSDNFDYVSKVVNMPQVIQARLSPTIVNLANRGARPL